MTTSPPVLQTTSSLLNALRRVSGRSPRTAPAAATAVATCLPEVSVARSDTVNRASPGRDLGLSVLDAADVAR
jgi:hypothetical protein